MKMNKSILLVEDDELDVISFQRSFKKLNANCEIETAYNGQNALNYLRNECKKLPDLILLDLNMPKMNGVEFLRTIRQDEQFKNIKVFIITTSAESKDREITEELGISGYIIKPLNYNNNNKNENSMDAFMEFHLRKIIAD